MANSATPKRASVFSETSRDGRSGWIYKWNTGELSVIFIPDDFHFDPTASVPLKTEPPAVLDK